MRRINELRLIARYPTYPQYQRRVRKLLPGLYLF